MRKSGYITCVIWIYCKSRSCAARESTIIEEGDRTVWHCPSCGSLARVRRRISLADYEGELLAAEQRARRLRNWR
jgi:hypothetical protein